MTIQDIIPREVRAGEVYGDFWLNGGPISVSGHRGQILLIDFWDYTSVESIRTIPYVRDWHRKYGPLGLVVVGVHTPRFRFAHDPEQVARVIHRLGIEYPVVLDNQQLVWTRYGNREWPTKHIIDRDGFLRYKCIGEGSYIATEHGLQNLLLAASLIQELPDLTVPFRDTDRPDVVLYRSTPEVFAGYVRGSVGNVEGYSPESVVEYVDPTIYVEGRFYLQGMWLNERDCLRYAGEGGHLAFPHQGTEVYAVLEPPRGKAVRVGVQQDGTPLGAEARGDDVEMDEAGRSFILVDEPRLYSLTRNREHGQHLLSLLPDQEGLAVYSMTCVSSVIPEILSST